MNLDSEVCNFDQARKFFNLGLEQDSLFYWAHIDIFNPMDDDIANYTIINKDNRLLEQHKKYSAFTASELAKHLNYDFQVEPQSRTAKVRLYSVYCRDGVLYGETLVDVIAKAVLFKNKDFSEYGSFKQGERLSRNRLL